MSHDRGQSQADGPGASEETLRTGGGLIATAFGLTDIGVQRAINQDTLGNRVGQYADRATNLGLLYAIADGMGGHAHGEVASALAIQHLFATYYGSDYQGSPPQRLVEAIDEANGTVFAAGRAANRGTMGTTLTMALLYNNTLYVGNIGDSRTYRLRGGRIEQLSQDHSLIGEQVRSGVLTEEQARQSTIRNVITRALGYREHVEADIFTYPVAAGDILLLCSDGLHGLVENHELAQILGGPSLTAAVSALIALARDRGGPDNITALAVRIDQVGERTATAARAVGSEAVTSPLPVLPPRRSVETIVEEAAQLPGGEGGGAMPASVLLSAADTPTDPNLGELTTLPVRQVAAPPPPPERAAALAPLAGLPPAPAALPAAPPPPLAPPPAPPPAAPPRRAFPVVFLVVLPVLLVALLGMGGLIAVRARDGGIAQPTAASAATGLSPTSAAPVTSGGNPPAIAPAATATAAPAPVAAAPTATAAPASSPPSAASPPAAATLLPVPTTVASAPPSPGPSPRAASPTAAASGSEPSRITGTTGTISFALPPGGPGIPADFPDGWEVVAFPRDAFGPTLSTADFQRMLADTVADREPLSPPSTPNGPIQYNLQIKLPAETAEREFILVLRQGTTRVMIPGDFTVKAHSGEIVAHNLEITRIFELGR